MLFIRKFLIVGFSFYIIAIGINNLFKGKDIILNFDNEVIIHHIDIGNNKLDNINIYNSNETIKEKKLDEVFLELYVPRINLRKNVYTMNSSKNDVNVNVELLKASDVDLNLYFLASHSGGGTASYFDDLVYLDKGDIVWLYKNEDILNYVVDDIFYIEKNGYFDVRYESSGNRLFLITCSLNMSTKQLVVTAKMVYKGKC